MTISAITNNIIVLSFIAIYIIFSVVVSTAVRYTVFSYGFQRLTSSIVNISDCHVLFIRTINKLNFVLNCGYIGVTYSTIIITKFSRGIRCNFSFLSEGIALTINQPNFHCSIWINLMIQHGIFNFVSTKIVINFFIILIITELRKCSFKITCRSRC